MWFWRVSLALSNQRSEKVATQHLVTHLWLQGSDLVSKPTFVNARTRRRTCNRCNARAGHIVRMNDVICVISRNLLQILFTAERDANPTKLTSQAPERLCGSLCVALCLREEGEVVRGTRRQRSYLGVSFAGLLREIESWDGTDIRCLRVTRSAEVSMCLSRGGI